MKKIKYSFYLLLFLFGCNDFNQNTNLSDLKNSQRKIDLELDRIFNQKYPNYQINELVKSNALIEFQNTIDSLVPNHILEDIPLQILKVQKNPNGSGAIVHFYARNFNTSEPKLLSDNVTFDLIGFTSEQIASSLNEKKQYFAFGHNHKRLSKEESDLIARITYYSNDIEIEENYSYRNTYAYNLGVYLVELDSIKPAKNYIE
jgi:hypothetical protein